MNSPQEKLQIYLATLIENNISPSPFLMDKINELNRQLDHELHSIMGNQLQMQQQPKKKRRTLLRQTELDFTPKKRPDFTPKKRPDFTPKETNSSKLQEQEKMILQNRE